MERVFIGQRWGSRVFMLTVSLLVLTMILFSCPGLVWSPRTTAVAGSGTNIALNLQGDMILEADVSLCFNKWQSSFYIPLNLGDFWLWDFSCLLFLFLIIQQRKWIQRRGNILLHVKQNITSRGWLAGLWRTLPCLFTGNKTQYVHHC